MNTQVGFALRGRNPDVLTCIANLSNDEVFTPPEFANRMLDTVAQAWAANHGGANLWTDKTVRFLDPCTKSGVFLREITSRLTEGLKADIPDLRERVNHIVTKQVFGIGITQLTSLLARRSVYCSKHANGEHSVAKGFARDEGNIWFERTEHTWNKGKCVYCGASQETLDRGENLETYAYGFIHTDNIKTQVAEIFGDDMQFYEVIELLLRHGAPINAHGINDWTPAHMAAVREDIQALKLLIQYGADLSIRTGIDDYATALEEARLLNSTQAVQLLENLAE